MLIRRENLIMKCSTLVTIIVAFQLIIAEDGSNIGLLRTELPKIIDTTRKTDTLWEIFLPGIISGNERVHCFPSFSSDMSTIYWSKIQAGIFKIREINGSWKYPEQISFSQGYAFQSPFIYRDSLLFYSARDSSGVGSLDIWQINIHAIGISQPINMGANINTNGIESHPSLSKNKNLYFTGTTNKKMFNRGIYFSEYKEGIYQPSVMLPSPINIVDTGIIDYTPYIDPDEQYLLFCSNRHNPGIEECHIYISLKTGDGKWSSPEDLTLMMEFKGNSKFPYVSPDKRFLFFCSGENIYKIELVIFDAFREIIPELSTYLRSGMQEKE